jgi:hypothetical protein
MDILSSTCRGNVVLVDNTQWCDPQSLSLIHELVESASPPSLVVMGSRAFQAKGYASKILRHPRATRMVLGPLSAADAGRIACQFLNVEAIPKSLAGFLEEKGQGVPLYYEQLLWTMLSMGFLEIRTSPVPAVDSDSLAGMGVGARSQRICRVSSDKSLAEMPVPKSVHDLLLQRFDALSAQGLLLVKCAAVIGGEFSLGDLECITPSHISKGQIVQALRELSLAGMVVSIQREEGRLPRFRFSLGSLQEAAYSLWLPSQRQELHAKYAKSLEKRVGQGVTHAVMFSTIVHHWLCAGKHQEVFQGLVSAGSAALSINDVPSALDFYMRARALSGDAAIDISVGQRASLENHLARAFLQSQSTEQCLEHCRNALMLLGLPEFRGGVYFPNLSLAWRFSMLGLRRHMGCGGGSEDGRGWGTVDGESQARFMEIATSYSILAKVWSTSNRNMRIALKAVLCQLEYAERAKCSFSELAEALGFILQLCQLRGNALVGSIYYERSLRCGKQMTDGVARAQLYLVQARVDFGYGQLGRALETCRAAHELCRNFTDVVLKNEVFGTFVFILLALGLHAELDECLALFRTGHNIQAGTLDILLLSNIGHALLMLSTEEADEGPAGTPRNIERIAVEEGSASSMAGEGRLRWEDLTDHMESLCVVGEARVHPYFQVLSLILAVKAGRELKRDVSRRWLGFWADGQSRRRKTDFRWTSLVSMLLACEAQIQHFQLAQTPENRRACTEELAHVAAVGRTHPVFRTFHLDLSASFHAAAGNRRKAAELSRQSLRLAEAQGLGIVQRRALRRKGLSA